MSNGYCCATVGCSWISLHDSKYCRSCWYKLQDVLDTQGIYSNQFLPKPEEETMNTNLNQLSKAMLNETILDAKHTLAKKEQEKYNNLLVRGKAMINIPDSPIKLILPRGIIEDMISSVQFAVAVTPTAEELQDNPNASEVLQPYDGQLNITYFTGEPNGS